MSVKEGQKKLKILAKKIYENTSLSVDEREFLSSALIQIASGEDAELALNVKAKKGERKSKSVQDNMQSRQFAMGWLATAIAPIDEGGLGLTLLDASAKIKLNLKNLPSEESLRRYWNDYKKNNGRTFKSFTD